jgi:hypothetical protein
MSCVYTYKNKTYTKEEFYDYMRTEHFPSLEKNDSKFVFYDLQDNQRLAEVSKLFDENPELAQIGTKEQYAEYLNTVFPNSQVQDIVYHGTIGDWYKSDSFDRTRGDKKTLNRSNEYGYWFGSNEEVARLFASVDIAQLSSLFGQGTAVDNALNEIQRQYKLDDSEIDKIVNLILEYNTLDFNDFSNRSAKRFYTPSTARVIQAKINAQNIKQGDTLVFAGMTRGDGANALEYLNKLGGDSIVLDMVEDGGMGGEEFELGVNYAVKKSDQIHILGSRSDIEMFRKFVSQENNDWTQIENHCPKLM